MVDDPAGQAAADRALVGQDQLGEVVAGDDRPADPDWIPFSVMNSLLGGSFGSRITTNIREQKGYAYSPYSTVDANVHTAHWMEVADVTTANTGDALKEIRTEIARLRTEPPPPPELTGIEKNMAGGFVVRNASRGGVIGQLAFVDLHSLGDDYLAKYVDRVQAVTPEQVTAMAKKYLDPDQMTLVIVGDEKVVKTQVDGKSQ